MGCDFLGTAVVGDVGLADPTHSVNLDVLAGVEL